MQNDYVILMDVSGDIQAEAAKENDVRFISMEYSIGEEMRVSQGIEPPEVIKRFYDGQRHGDLTHTTQIAPQHYEKYMKTILEDGKDILYLALSSGLSSTYQSACLAKRNLKEKYPERDVMVVDSLSASGGIGLLCERAIRNRKAGMSLKENFNDVEEATHHICHWFVVQDLNYLKRGGRVSAATAAVGTMLHVKPILMIDKEGKLQTIAKARGTKNAVNILMKDFQETKAEPMMDPIYIMDADNPLLGDELAQEVLAVCPEAEIRRASLSPIIGAHTGPDLGAIIHMGK